MSRNKLIARFIALRGVRNTMLEDLHSGIFPFSKTGDFSDVTVVTPDGSIPWNEISRISDKEMRKLMLDIERHIEIVLNIIPDLENETGSAKKFEAILNETLFKQGGASWDMPENKVMK